MLDGTQIAEQIVVMKGENGASPSFVNEFIKVLILIVSGQAGQSAGSQKNCIDLQVIERAWDKACAALDQKTALRMGKNEGVGFT